MIEDNYNTVEIHLTDKQKTLVNQYAESRGFTDWNVESLIQMLVDRGVEDLKIGTSHDAVKCKGCGFYTNRMLPTCNYCKKELT